MSEIQAVEVIELLGEIKIVLIYVISSIFIAVGASIYAR